MKTNLILIFVGIVFFANPNFYLLDILPDFLGAVLIMIGLSKMYMYDANFEDARKSAKYLFWISLLRLLLCMWTNSGNRDYVLPFTFMLCTVEAIFMISMFKGIYLGAQYTLMRSDCERHIKSVTDAFTMSFLFVIASKVLEFAPCICDIFSQDAELDLSSGASFKMPMAQMKVYVTGVCLICSAIVGVIFVIVSAKAHFKMICDKKYRDFLSEKFTTYTINEREEYVSGKIKRVYILLICSFAFFFDFYIDGINVLPQGMAVLLLMFCSLTLCPYSKTKKRKTFFLFLLSLVSSSLVYAYMTKVHLGINYSYSLEAFYKEDFPYLSQSGSVVVSLLLSLFSLVCTASLLLFVFSQMRKTFEVEKRKVALPMIKFLAVPSLFALVCSASRNVLTTLEAHLATRTRVLDYIKNKAYITDERIFEEFMQDKNVVMYEKVSTYGYILSFVCVLFVIISMLYTVRIWRFTDKEN